MFLFDQTSFAECGICAVLLDSAETASRNVDAHRFLDFRDVNTLLLEIWVATNLTARIELRCTGTVRISSSDD